MIKFFRKIRQHLLSEGNTGKYLKYAVGEIVLVVIGILIALSINKWNDNQKKLKQEKTHLQNIQNDLKAQIKTLDNYIEFQNLIIEDSKNIIQHYENNGGFNKMERIYPMLNDLIVRTTFINKNISLSEIINSSEINILRNEVLIRKLLEFNQSVLTFMNTTQNNNTNLIDLLIVPTLAKNSDYATFGYTNKMNNFLEKNGGRENITYLKNKNLKNGLNQTFNDPKLSLELMNKVVMRYEIASLQKIGNENLKEQAEDILITIQKELDRK